MLGRAALDVRPPNQITISARERLNSLHFPQTMALKWSRPESRSPRCTGLFHRRANWRIWICTCSAKHAFPTLDINEEIQSMASGDDIEAGRVTGAESRTILVGQKPSDLGNDFNGDFVF